MTAAQTSHSLPPSQPEPAGHTERPTASGRLADRIEMQNLLFAELSRMFGEEVPLYDKSLLVNRVCNRVVCDMLAELHIGFSIGDDQLERTSAERHGAIRIGRPDEYRWIARLFAAFAMEPHNYYDTTAVGRKSQPIIATAFRSKVDPEHRVFCSLLMTDYFDDATRSRIEALLATRTVFSDRAKALVEKGERQGGLDWDDSHDLISEATDRIFKWTGRARDHRLYVDLCEAGFKIAADIACFESHHLNHLTPNTFCMDLYTSAMKFCLGELDGATFRHRAEKALARLSRAATGDWMRLHFRHLDAETIADYTRSEVPAMRIEAFVDRLTRRLQEADLHLSEIKHAGFKDFTEGPPQDTPILLRQDAYKALTEPVTFRESDGSDHPTVHTARFGEIEQRFYATTAAGRALYDRCLAAADAEKDRDPGLAKRDFDAYETMYARHFAEFPKTLPELLDAKLVYGRWHVTSTGLAAAAAGAVESDDLAGLLRRGFVRREGIRYEDFLPVSAAGIFASNLNQYGTKSTASTKPTYRREMLEEILGRSIIDADAVYRAIEAESIREATRVLAAR